jgi:hypothetical protein
MLMSVTQQSNYTLPYVAYSVQDSSVSAFVSPNVSATRSPKLGKRRTIVCKKTQQGKVGEANQPERIFHMGKRGCEIGNAQDQSSYTLRVRPQVYKISTIVFRLLHRRRTHSDSFTRGLQDYIRTRRTRTKPGFHRVG